MVLEQLTDTLTSKLSAWSDQLIELWPNITVTTDEQPFIAVNNSEKQE